MSDIEEQPLDPVPPKPVTILVPAEVALIPVAAAALGLSQKAIRRRIEEGIWQEGFQYHRRDGRVWIDLQGVARWVRGAAAAA